jgi:hypothetical protein
VVARGLSRAGTVIGASIATGALVSAGLVAWHPLPLSSALVLPFLVAVVGTLIYLVLVAALVREAPRHDGGFGSLVRSASQAPRQVVEGVQTLGRNHVLRCLVLVEVFWAVGMVGFETLMPVRLAELAGGVETAAVILGPVAAVAWGLYAVGSALAGLAAGRLGVVWVAIGARVLNGTTIVVMGLVAGPVGLVLAYLATYTTHGINNPVHATLLHRQATEQNRVTVLSMNSLVSGGCYSLGVLALAPLADATSTGLAMIVAGGFSAIGALLYVPALGHERSAPGS